MTINELLKKDKGFFKANLKGGKIIIKITKSAYSIDFSKQNTLTNIFGFGNKVLTKATDHIFVWCNLIDDSYANNRKINSIYKFKLDHYDEIL
jgi:hypothetical protein